jgi:hypothetical protein
MESGNGESDRTCVSLAESGRFRVITDLDRALQAEGFTHADLAEFRGVATRKKLQGYSDDGRFCGTSEGGRSPFAAPLSADLCAHTSTARRAARRDASQAR